MSAHNTTNLRLSRCVLGGGATVALTFFVCIAPVAAASASGKDATVHALREMFMSTTENVREVSSKGTVLGDWALLQAQKGDLPGADYTYTAVARLADEWKRLNVLAVGYYDQLKVRVLVGIVLARRQSGDIAGSQLLLEMARNEAQACLARLRYTCLEQIFVTAVRMDEMELASQAFDQTIEAVQAIPDNEIHYALSREVTLLGVFERRVALELALGHVQAAKRTLSDVLTRVQSQAAPTVKWHLARIAPLQIALGEHDAAEANMRYMFALREQVLRNEQGEDLILLTRKFAFYKVAENSALASAYGLAGQDERGVKKLQQALDALGEVHPDDQGFAWWQILRAAATLGKEEIITRGARYTQEGMRSDEFLGEILERLVAGGHDRVAQMLATISEAPERLAEAYVRAGKDALADEFISTMDLYLQPTDLKRLFSRSYAKLHGINQAIEWSQQWKDPRTRAYALLGILDQLDWTSTIAVE